MKPLTNSSEDKLGDIFWDLAPWVHYIAGYDLGCIIYVANNTDLEKEYTLIGHTYRNGVLQSEGTLQVHEHAWFVVSPGDFIRLHGTIMSDESDITFTVGLVEKKTQEATDSVSTILVTPTTATLPPGWNIPGVPTTPTIDINSIMNMMMMMLIVVMMMKMMTSALKSGEGKKLVT